METQIESFRRILAVVDTSLDAHPALELAVVVARATSGTITLFDVVPDFGWPARFGSLDTSALRDELVRIKERELEKLAQPLRADGMRVECKVAIGKTSARIIEEVERSQMDVVIRLTKGTRSRREGFLGTTSIRLLRHCPCPVWLVRPGEASRFERIVAAVDLGTFDTEHQTLNYKVVNVARFLRDLHQGSVEVVYAWTIFGESLLRERMSAEEFERLIAVSEAEQRRALTEFLAAVQMPPDTCQATLLRGDPSLEIPRHVAARRADVIVLGTVARKGIAGFMIGNTAERILDKVHCAILALKPT